MTTPEVAAALAGLERLKAETQLDDPFIGELCASFFERGGEYLQQLERASDAGDEKTLLVAAHTFLGMALNLRFDALAKPAERLCSHARGQTREDVTALLHTLTSIFAELRTALVPDQPAPDTLDA